MFKVSLSVFAFMVSFLATPTVLAATKITGVNVNRSAAGVAIDMTFDRPFQARALKPAFERNFAQVVLKGMKIDSARMIPVAASEVQKVFAYPYNLDTARVRIIFKHDGAWGKGHISVWNNNPRSVRIFVRDPSVVSSVAKSTQAKAADRAPAAEHGLATRAAAASAADGTTEEKTILREVVANTRDIDINNPDSLKAALHAPEKTTDNKALSGIDKAEEKGPVGISSDPTKHFARMAIALFGVLALFLGAAFLVKRYAGKLKKLPFGKKERLIQVMATHYLGNKNSISLVKITGEYMVVGVSNEGISLISKLGPEVNVDQYIEDRFWNGTFEKHLDSYSKDSKANKETDLSNYDGARDLTAPAEGIRAKAEDKAGISPVRASIRQKLTKLKPLA